VIKTPLAAIIPILFPALLAGQMQEDSLGLKGYVPKPLLLSCYPNLGAISAYFLALFIGRFEKIEQN